MKKRMFYGFLAICLLLGMIAPMAAAEETTLPSESTEPAVTTEPTAAPTEPTTVPTEPTTVPTEPSTEPPTEPTTAPTEPALPETLNGVCGPNATWVYYTDTKHLVISGSGAVTHRILVGPVLIEHMYTHLKYTSITFEPGITSIGADVFSSQYDLQKITLPNTLTKIGDQAFRNCHALTSADLPSSLVSVGDNAFHDCSLTSVTIPTSLTTIGNYAFASNNISALTIPATVVTVGTGAFSANNLTSVTVDNSMEGFGNGVFSSNRKLANIKLTDAVKTLPYGVFGDSESLRSITIPASVTSIGALALNNRYLEEVHFKGSLPQIDATAFRDVDMVACYYPAGNNTYEPETKERYGADVMIWLGKGSDGSYSGTCNNGKVKWVLKNGTLTISGNGNATGWIEKQQPYWYPQRHAIKKVVFSGNIKYVGPRAFMNCVNLTDIQWVDSIISFESNAFAGCTSLTSVDLPDSITGLSGGMFSGCTNLRQIDLPAGLLNMYMREFYNCSSLTSITIPYGVTYVMEDMFVGCTNLTAIYFRGDLPKRLIDGTLNGFTGTVYYTPGNKTWTQKITELEARYPGVTFAPKGAPAQPNPGTPSTSPDTPTTNPDITPETTSPHTTVPVETTIPVPTETTVPETVETTVSAVTETQTDTTGTAAADITTTVPSSAVPVKKGNNGALIVAMLAAGTLSLGTVVWQFWRKRR